MSTARPFPPYDGASYNVADSIAHQIVNLTALLRREVEARMVEHGLTDAQWKPLLMLATARATTAFELAREMCIDAGAVTRMLDRLEAKGLVERLRSEADRRVVHLHLTPAGEEAAAKVPHVLASVNNDFLRGFSETEWKQMGRLLGRMVANGNALQTAPADAEVSA
jgi:DNA-binding MarR family transcriptional regulator